jgi:D-alanine-D-alanine ligase
VSSIKDQTRVLFCCGGRSDEHEISLISAFEMLKALDDDRFEALIIGIDRAGAWRFCDPDDFVDGPIRADTIRLRAGQPDVLIAPQAERGRGTLYVDRQRIEFDVAFPILHGPYGEDGTIQGLFEMIGVPFVGAGTAASANCMDKERTKILCQAAGIPVTPWVVIRSPDELRAQREAIERLHLPLFVKPARAGSSVGVSRVDAVSQLPAAVAAALRFDSKCLIERAIAGREIECAVLGLCDSPKASIPGEVIPSPEAGFYSYEAKYLLEGGARLDVPANLGDAEVRRVQETAKAAFQTLECDGMARIDVFLSDGTIYLNEPNTIPGFTPISMYPKMWQASGLAYSDLLTRLIELAFERYGRERR